MVKTYQDQVDKYKHMPNTDALDLWRIEMKQLAKTLAEEFGMLSEYVMYKDRPMSSLKYNILKDKPRRVDNAAEQTRKGPGGPQGHRCLSRPNPLLEGCIGRILPQDALVTVGLQHPCGQRGAAAEVDGGFLLVAPPGKCSGFRCKTCTGLGGVNQRTFFVNLKTEVW